MVKVIISDFARVILFPKDSTYIGILNALHGKLIQADEHYDFFQFFFLNDDLLHFYESLKPSYTMCVFTEASSIQQIPVVKERMGQVFQYVFTPNDIGTLKTDPRSYLYISQHLNVDPENMLFIDDRIANLDAAHKVGVQTVQYSSNDKLFQELKRFGIEKP